MEWNFDLLGDPIPDGFGKRGRPPHIPTQENRNKIILLLAQGWPLGRIASALSITQATLKKHYFRELRARDEARDRVEATLMARCWAGVEKGNVGAIKEFRRILDRLDMITPHRSKSKAASKPGKKEMALEAARRPDTGTQIGDLMARRAEMVGKPH